MTTARVDIIPASIFVGRTVSRVLFGVFGVSDALSRVSVMRSGPSGSACQNDTRSIRPP